MFTLRRERFTYRVTQGRNEPRLKRWGGPRFGSQHPGACAPQAGLGVVREGVAPYRCECPGCDRRKFF